MTTSEPTAGAQPPVAGVPTSAIASRSGRSPERLAPPLCVTVPAEARRLRSLTGRDRDAAISALLELVAAAPENDQAWSREFICHLLHMRRREFDHALQSARQRAGLADPSQALTAAYLAAGAPTGRALRAWLSARGFPVVSNRFIKELRLAARIHRGAALQTSARAPENAAR